MLDCQQKKTKSYTIIFYSAEEGYRVMFIFLLNVFVLFLGAPFAYRCLLLRYG
jgi:hypothetical protein